MDSYKKAALEEKCSSFYLTWKFPSHYFVLTWHTKLGTWNFHFQADRAESANAHNCQKLSFDTLFVFKGGSSSKLTLQVLNTDSHVHSNRYAKMIGIYEGDKENRVCIGSIFGNLINDIQDTCENIKSLPLRSHKLCPTSVSTCSSYRVQSTDKELLV